MKNQYFAFFVFGFLFFETGAVGDERTSLKSGLQPGETIASFHVEDVTGPAKGKSICYACRYGSRPVVNVFVREITDEVVTLMRQLDAQVEKHKDEQLQVFLVLLSLDPESDRETLENLAAKQELKHVPLTLFDGLTGPPKMKIAQRADVTIMLWNKAKVKSNHAFTSEALNDKAVAAVIKEIPDLLK